MTGAGGGAIFKTSGTKGAGAGAGAGGGAGATYTVAVPIGWLFDTTERLILL